MRLRILLIGLLSFMSPVIPGHGAAGDVVILFDQSARLQSVSPLDLSILYAQKFATHFKQPYELVFVGFSDELTKEVRVNSADAEIIEDGELAVIADNALATDMEKPFAYLQTYERPIFQAVIISDGMPELWDEYHYYLSQAIIFDRRYEHLNEEYHRKSRQGLARARLYELLGDAYLKWNIKLIEEQLPALQDTLTGKLTVIDISGRYPFLQKWSRMTGAEFILSPMDKADVSLLQLQRTIAELGSILDKKLSRLASEHEKNIETTTVEGDVHRELEIILELILPAAKIAAGPLGNQLGYGDDQSGFFSN